VEERTLFRQYRDLGERLERVERDIKATERRVPEEARDIETFILLIEGELDEADPRRHTMEHFESWYQPLRELRTLLLRKWALESRLAILRCAIQREQENTRILDLVH
jgi:vacuolar-type H+-ATPase subunit I/STV1